MSPSITLSTEVFSRLQHLGEPFVDTPESVIVRLLDCFENGAKSGASGAADSEITIYDGGSPPNLTHTKVLAIRLEDEAFPPSERFWNYLLFELVRRAGAAKKTPEDIVALTQVNAVIGIKEDSGYRHIPEAGISVQGQDANGAWKGVCGLASSLGLAVDVSFAWYNNSKAVKPGASARLVIEGVRQAVL